MSASSKLHTNGAVSYDPNPNNHDQHESNAASNANSLSRRGTTSRLRDKMRLRKSTYETPAPVSVPAPAPSLPPTLSLSFDAPPPNSNGASHQDQLSASQAPPSPSRTSSLPLPSSSPPPPPPLPNASNSDLKPRKKSMSSKNRPTSPQTTKGMTPAEVVAMQAMQSPTSNDQKKIRRDPSLATPQEKLEAVRNAKLNVDMINRVVEFCGSEIRMRGLATIGIFRPFRFSENQAKQTALIQLVLLTVDPTKYESVFSLDEASAQASASARSSKEAASQNGDASHTASSLANLFTSPDSPAKELTKALNKANIHDVIALLKWSLRHTKLTPKDFGSSGSSFDWYERFAMQEKANGYPAKALSLYLLSSLPPSTSTYLTSILSLLTTIGSHHSANAMPCPRLCGMLGYWILGRIGKESHWNLDDTTRDWERCKNVLSHLMLAFIREMEGEKGVISIPSKLKELIEGYPYFPSLRSQFSSVTSQPPDSQNQEAAGPTSEGKVQIQSPSFPLAFSPPPQKALRVNLRSQNLIISSKRPRAPSETLRAAFGVETGNEPSSNPSNRPEENVWKLIVEEGKKAEDASKAPRKREFSNGGFSTSSNGGSNSGSPVPPQTPQTSSSERALSVSSPSLNNANPTPAQEEERERIRDEAREKAIVLEDHARILKLVAKSLKERRKLNEDQEKEKSKSSGLAGNESTSTSTSGAGGLGSPYSSAKGLDKLASGTGSPEFDMTPGSESTLLSSPASRPSPFSRSVTEFGTFPSPSLTTPATQSPSSKMRRSISHNGHVVTPELESLPEDADTKYTWLNGFSSDEKPVDLSLSNITLSNSNSNGSQSANGAPGSNSQRARRQSSFGSLKRKSIRSSSFNNASNGSSFSNQLDSLPPPPPSHQISSIEIFPFDESFQSFWQDCLLEGSLPPFVLVGLKEVLLNNLYSRSSLNLSESNSTENLSRESKEVLTNEIDREFLQKEKITYLLIDEVASPPLPKNKPPVANSIDGASYDGRKSFAPSIKSLSASIKKLTNSWRRPKRDV